MPAFKYLRCACCNFMAVIPENDKHEDLPCPFCVKASCSDRPVGEFEQLSKDEFKREAGLEES